jgi:hypothetical protein
MFSLASAALAGEFFTHCGGQSASTSREVAASRVLADRTEVFVIRTCGSDFYT